MTHKADPIIIRIIYGALLYMRSLIITYAVIMVASVVLLAQTGTQFPSPTSHLNDFAGVIDEQTKTHLENLLSNLKDKTKVEFYVATVDTPGDIVEFSRKLSTSWNIGTKTSRSKSLLLVISVASKTSISQFSRLMQLELPEGFFGEMTQRMRTPLSAGRFGEALEQGVQLFVGSVAQKMGFGVHDLETSTISTDTQPQTTEPKQEPTTEPAKTRPRVVSQSPKTEEKETAPDSSEVKPTTNDAASETAREVKQPDKNTAMQPTRASEKPPKVSGTSKKNVEPKKIVEPVDDEDESEQVELTLTLPLAKRAEKLKEFLETHPDSKSRPRATELLISTHAGLGDQFLKAGEIEKGIQHLRLAIDEADVSISDKLFTGVISQIPSNLYLRGQGDAAFTAATAIETKFGSDPKRLLTVAAFYLGIERGDESGRIAEAAIKLAPEMAEAHRVLAVSRHINLQLDEAAAEYKRTVELEPTSKASLSTLADLTRAQGKPEEALTLYKELLKNDSNDRAATAGMVLCLFELGRKDEATSALDAALATEPRNLALLSGAAYWFAAHGEYEKAFDFARKAVSIEPRYTWAQIALVRSLIGLKRPVGAERAMRYARQYGKFPTLNYELANVVAAMGFYDEAAEILRESFTFKDGQVETLLAGHIPARDTDFLSLLSTERRASIYQPTAADSAANSKMLTNLLALDSALTDKEGEKINETAAAETAREFGSGTDSMRAFRQLYAAGRLLRKTVALPTAMELVDEAKTGLEVALDVPVVTSAAQADEFRGLRAQAIATGTIPDIEDAPRSALSNIMRGRIEDLTGWILFNQDKYPEAIEHLKQAATILPNGTPAWRNTLWHLGVAFEQTSRNDEALESYIKSYNSGERDPIRRSVIEKLYRKINGSLDGLDDKIGPGLTTSATAKPTETVPDTKVETPANTAQVSPQPTPEKTTTTDTTTGSTTTPETTVPKPEALPTPTPTSTQPAEATPPAQPEPISDEALKAAGSRLRSNIRITGRVLDAKGDGISNVVVVLISPSGSVLASTTDNEGRYSFTVMPSQKTYRVIPSKDGYTFTPVDKVFLGLIDDQRGIDFTGSGNP